MTTATNPSQRLNIAVTRALPPQVIAQLQERHDVWVNPEDRRLTPDELQRAAVDADAMIVTALDRFDVEAMAKLPATLRIVATYSVGYEHIDVEAARARGLAVLFTPDVLSDAVAEMAILLMLGAARRAQEGDRMMYERRWTGWTPTQLIGLEVTGKRIGIVGMGRIGRTIARRARGFDMTVHYHNRQRLGSPLEDSAIFHPTIEGLMAASDVLVLAAPSTPQTRGLVNAARLAMMPRGGVVVNIARGDLIDDAALIEALKSTHIAAAGLDVFNNEPAVHEGYFDLPNVFLQPHQGSSTLTARQKMAALLLDGMDAVLAEQAAHNRLA